MIIEIGNKEYELKFNIGAWRRLKKVDITANNIEEKIEGDPAETIFQLITCAVKPLKDGTKPTVEEIEELDFNVSATLIEAMQQATPIVKDDGPKN